MASRDGSHDVPHSVVPSKPCLDTQLSQAAHLVEGSEPIVITESCPFCYVEVDPAIYNLHVEYCRMEMEEQTDTIMDDGLTPAANSSPEEDDEESSLEPHHTSPAALSEDQGVSSRTAEDTADEGEATIGTEGTDGRPCNRRRRARVTLLETSESSSSDADEDGNYDCSDHSNSEAYVSSGPDAPRPKRVKCMTPEEVVLQGLTYGLNADVEVKDAGRKGRGLFAVSRITKGSYLCEYRTCRVYHPSKKEKYVAEYEQNGEGSYLLETQYGKRLIFDATRCYDQFGRFMNHSTKSPNCRYWRPLFVRGKLRVGFVATRDIEAGEEVVYDYGVRGLDWMSRPSPAASPRKTKKSTSKSFEEYRRRRYCPVPGCPARKALKKLPNHLKQMHPSLTKEEAAKMLQVAKYQAPGGGKVQVPVSTQASISSFFNQEGKSGKGKDVPGRRAKKAQKNRDELDSPAPSPQAAPGPSKSRKGKNVPGRRAKSALITEEAPGSSSPTPQSATVSQKTGTATELSKQKGSTRKYPTFDVPTTPFLSSLLSHAEDRFGLGMGPAAAKELVADVNKFLHFAGKGEVQVAHLCDTERVREYLFKLEEDGIGSSGQLTKLTRIGTALSYASSTGTWMEGLVDVQDAKDLFARWSKRLQREKTTHLKSKLPDDSEEVKEQDLSNYASLLGNEHMLKQVREATAADSPSPAQFDLLRNYIALFLFIKCAQRKSAVEGLTIAEFEKATRVEGSTGPHWIFSARKHKTACKGPAAMVVDGATKGIMDHYLLHRRGRGSSDRLLVNHRGTASSRLPSEVQKFASDYGVSLPTPTLHRKVIGTKAARLPQQAQEKVAGLMSHSLNTQRRYYRALQDKEHTVEAFEAVSSLLPVPTLPPLAKSVKVAKRFSFQPEQVAEIEKAFASHVRDGKCPTLGECAAFLEAHRMEGRTSKHIQDRVRTMIRGSKK